MHSSAESSKLVPPLKQPFLSQCRELWDSCHSMIISPPLNAMQIHCTIIPEAFLIHCMHIGTQQAFRIIIDILTIIASSSSFHVLRLVYNMTQVLRCIALHPEVHIKWFGRQRNAGIEFFSISTLHCCPNHIICTSGCNATQRKPCIIL